MKLLLITSVTEFTDDIRKMLKNAEIQIFSYKEVNGFRDTTLDAVGSNWFGSEYNENKSILFYAFVNQEKSDDLFAKIEDFNTNLKSKSKIHVAVLNIEKSN